MLPRRWSRNAQAEAEAEASQIVELPWAETLRVLQWDWGQGQHVTMLGRTGSGKTTLAIQLLDQRRYVFAILTKRHDDLFPLFRAKGYKMLRSLTDDRPGTDVPAGRRIALHISPEGLTRAAAKKQAAEVLATLEQLWEERAWTVYFDEIASIADQLGLATELRQLWKEARSSKITMVVGTQRPARIPLEAYTEPRYLFLWRSTNVDQQKRLSEIATNPDPVRAKVAQLERHEVLVVDTHEDYLWTTRPPKLR